MKKTRFPTGLTEEEKDKPYAKYFYRTPARIPYEIMQAIQSGPMKSEDALPFERMNDLLQLGYHKRETGYCFMPDNSCSVAVLTKMPGGTGEMLD
jgi:phloretin hydrolase